MTPAALKAYLNNLVNKNLKISTMIWGAPALEKLIIVAQIDQENNIDKIAVRLCQNMTPQTPLAEASGYKNKARLRGLEILKPAFAGFVCIALPLRVGFEYAAYYFPSRGKDGKSIAAKDLIFFCGRWG